MISIGFYWCLLTIFISMEVHGVLHQILAILSSLVHLSKASNSILVGLIFGTPVFFQKVATVHPKHP